MSSLKFELKFVPAGTGAAVWDDPYAHRMLERFMPQGRQHGPMVGFLNLDALRPTPEVLRNIVFTPGEDVRAGRYGNGNFAFVVASQDEATRRTIADVAAANDLAIFVSSSWSDSLENAEPAGSLTAKERETMSLVLRAGGTVTAAQLAQKEGIEQTTAGNRLVALQKKGFLQRVERPHPVGDLFIDPRSVRFDNPEAEHEGIIQRVDDAGFGYILESKTGRTFGFRFRDIPSYAGESANQLGLLPGSRLFFKTGPNGTVQQVRLPKTK